MEPRIVLHGDWSAMEGADVSASFADGGYLTVTTIDLERDPILFEQVDGDGDGGSDRWEERTVLATDDGLSNGVNFESLGRHSLAIHDNRLIIGAPNGNFGAGEAAIYRLNDQGVWEFETVVTAPDLSAEDGFGWSVDIHGNTAVIGTRFGGAAFVFSDSGGWVLERTLLPEQDVESGRFGFSVAIHGSVIAVGSPGEEMLDEDPTSASGAVYLYERAGNKWEQAAHLGAPESALDAEFGYSVDVHSSSAVVGAWLDDDMGEDSGSVFALGRYGSEWLIESKLTPDRQSPGARFGYQVAAGGSRAAAIALGSDDGAVASWAEVFHRSADQWTSEGRLVADDDGLVKPEYRSADFRDDRIVLGATFADGAAIVFRPGPSDTWELDTMLLPSDESGARSVGFDVALHGDTVLLGGLAAPGFTEDGEPVPVHAVAWVFGGPAEGPGDDDDTGFGTRWIVRSLGELPGVEGDPVSDILTWTDVKDGQTYAAVATTEGLILFTRSADRTTWTIRNLTDEIPGAESIAGDISIFGTRGNGVHIVGYSASGDLLIYLQPNTGEPGNWDWDFINISERDLRPQGIATPRLVGPISTFTTRWDAMNITGLDSEGRIRAVWIGPGMARWTASDLSANAGTPALVGSLAAFTTTWGAMNLAGVDSDGALIVTWWVPGFDRWVISDFNALFGGAALEPDSISAYTTQWGGLNIIGRDTRGDVIAYWWVPKFAEKPATDRWHVANLSNQVGDDEPPLSVLTGLVTPDGQINLFGTNRLNDVIRYFWEQDDGWLLENLTHLAEPA